MKDAIKELLNDRRSLKEAAIVAVLFPLVYFGMNLIGWGNEMFSWWETLLVAPVNGFFYWIFLSGFRRFANEDVTPSKFGE
ncbi:MAG: hypothetical protein ACTICI_14895 [Brevibacterium aurantiacum]|uniref:Uncharacterized protein n=4 Tax=Brevibacterium TaxID=1696 RepID=A0A2H1I0Z4_BREAU|nr:MULTISPECIES: hypothetical protein [Brevibacterium]RCS94426.1 hypothetical protein CIK61_13335 [Brevibacterium aurantiacum]SMX68784.1 hypothetical protein BAURA63_00744 [Brevibacterium aurantiacum]SMX70640.1 hypothetical protein BANT918_00597 [Brevibacterium antiquum CNRZ 918]SMX81990.1 hypothetical protein BANT10_01583 [Brevibacterium antiquum]HCG55126.1 hypothetical protein [Brevibacterium sp.]